MTRADLLTKLARRLGKNASSLDAATQNRLLDHLNARHREILSWPGMQRFRQRRLTIASVANQALYAIPNCANIITIGEATNDQILSPRGFHEYRRHNPDPASSTGTPEAYVPIGTQQVAAQPSDASSLFVDSTAAGDTQTCYIEGYITGGYPRSVSVTLTGTTAVNVSAAVSTWIGIEKFYLSSAAVGVVTLHEDADGGTELARIGIGQTWQQYYAFYLDPTPSGAITYTVDAELLITDFAQSTDQPLIPHDFHDLLIFGALMDEYEKGDDSRYQQAERQWQQRASDLRLYVARLTDGPINGGTGRSQLGPYFPAGS